jgi:hypothetical protein
VASSAWRGKVSAVVCGTRPVKTCQGDNSIFDQSKGGQNYIPATFCYEWVFPLRATRITPLQDFFNRSDDIVDGKTKLLHQLASRAAGAVTPHADDLALEADVALPAEG